MSGFFGCASKKDCVLPVFYGTDYHSHMGTKRAGLVVLNEEKGFQRRIHKINNAYFRNKFEDDIKDFEGNTAIGVISDTDPQPIIFNSHLGVFAVATVGRLYNLEELATELLNCKSHFTETFEGKANQTEVVANLIIQKENFVSGIEHVFNKVKGSCSILILTPSGIIAARDHWGRTPVIIGKNDDGYAVTSETCAFPNTGYETYYELGAGEIVEINAQAFIRLKEPNKQMQVCSFLWVYYGYPTSTYEQINVEESRYVCGAQLAKHEEEKADFVCGIADSGIGHAVGFANAIGLPYKRAISKYTPTWPRSFMPQNQNMRDLVAKMKLIPNKEMLKNKTIIFLDDSIVRGTQLRDNAKELREAGAKKVHMRIACPPLLFPCNYLNFSTSRSTMELATHKAIFELEGGQIKNIEKYADETTVEHGNMVKKIAEHLNLDSLKFQKLHDLIEAIGLPKEQLCTHCWDGSGNKVD